MQMAAVVNIANRITKTQNVRTEHFIIAYKYSWHCRLLSLTIKPVSKIFLLTQPQALRISTHSSKRRFRSNMRSEAIVILLALCFISLGEAYTVGRLRAIGAGSRVSRLVVAVPDLCNGDLSCKDMLKQATKECQRDSNDDEADKYCAKYGAQCHAEMEGKWGCMILYGGETFCGLIPE
ncbi:unnamed protein product [Mortierella alpina]